MNRDHLANAGAVASIDSPELGGIHEGDGTFVAPLAAPGNFKPGVMPRPWPRSGPPQPSAALHKRHNATPATLLHSKCLRLRRNIRFDSIDRS